LMKKEGFDGKGRMNRKEGVAGCLKGRDKHEGEGIPSKKGAIANENLGVREGGNDPRHPAYV